MSFTASLRASFAAHGPAVRSHAVAETAEHPFRTLKPRQAQIRSQIALLRFVKTIEQLPPSRICTLRPRQDRHRCDRFVATEHKDKASRQMKRRAPTTHAPRRSPQRPGPAGSRRPRERAAAQDRREREALDEALEAEAKRIQRLPEVAFDAAGASPSQKAARAGAWPPRTSRRCEGPGTSPVASTRCRGPVVLMMRPALAKATACRRARGGGSAPRARPGWATASTPSRRPWS